MSEENNIEFNNELGDVESKLKMMKMIEELEIDFMRDKIPEDIREKCLGLCKDYLGGNWTQQTTKTIHVRPITGGLMNKIYYCRIIESNTNESVPQEVAIRFYGQHVHPSETSRIKDHVISLVFSVKQMGPKIYGIFEGGQIQQFYKHRLFEGEEQKNDKLVDKVFRSLARIHSWSLPLKRNNDFFGPIEESLESAFKSLPINEMIDEFNCETLKKYDLKTEFQWIKSKIKECGSPLIFTHNDFKSSNLMITEPNEELVVCDYDISGYGYRGNDFVPLMSEWGRNPFDFVTINGLTLESEFKPYIEIYVDECERIYGKSYSQNVINSVEHILKETKIFLLFSYLFMALIPIKLLLDMGETDKEEESCDYKMSMEYTELEYKNYHMIKEILIKNKVFD